MADQNSVFDVEAIKELLAKSREEAYAETRRRMLEPGAMEACMTALHLAATLRDVLKRYGVTDSQIARAESKFLTSTEVAAELRATITAGDARVPPPPDDRRVSVQESSP